MLFAFGLRRLGDCHGVRHGDAMGVRKRKGHINYALVCRNAGGGTVERHGRLASGIANHLDVLHGDAICENARAQRLAHRLFGSKASGVVRSGIGFSVAVILFTLGEHLARERRRTIENAPHAIDFDDIYSQTNGHAGPFYCFEMLLQTAAKNRPLY